MKKTVVLASLLLGSVAVSDLQAQGQFRWGNTFAGAVRAPIYGVDPLNPMLAQHGNPTNGNPVGNTIYNGPLLSGTGYSAAIYLGLSPSEVMVNNSTPRTNGMTTFRTGAAAGFLPILLSEDPQHPGGTPNVAYQFRAWDNQGGTITSWAQVMARGGTVPSGVSDIYVFGGPLGVGTITPPDTTQIRSFNLTQVVPEPSLIALGALGLGALLLRRRK